MNMNPTVFADYSDHYMMNALGWVWGSGLLLMLFITLLLIFAVVFAIKLISNWTSSKYTNIDPLDIARSRYAKGDITKEQFNEIKKELKS